MKRGSEWLAAGKASSLRQLGSHRWAAACKAATTWTVNPAAPTSPLLRRSPEPGFMGVAPGRGVIMCAPVSVCHHVSTTATLPLPTTSWYQRQASGLMGSPTVPRMRSVVRLR